MQSVLCYQTFIHSFRNLSYDGSIASSFAENRQRGTEYILAIIL
jgi:hypothetical protein